MILLYHRRRIELEDKAKVGAGDLGTESLPCLLTQSFFYVLYTRKRLVKILLFLRTKRIRTKKELFSIFPNYK